MAAGVHGSVSTSEVGRDIVRVEGLVKTFDGTTQVLKGVDLTVGDGEFVALLGRSGGGKTTALRILEGLDPDYSGTDLVPEQRSVVFQEPRLLPWQPVWQNVVLGIGGSRSEKRAIARDALQEVGLSHRADAWPRTLSGGEAQRAGLARALVREPSLLLLDEPFGALDALTRLRMHGLLRKLIAKHRPGVVLVTHDVQEAVDLADRIVVLDAGTITASIELTGIRGSEDEVERLVEVRERVLAALGVEYEI